MRIKLEKSALFISALKKKQMKMIKRSHDLETFLRENNDVSKWKGGDTFSINLAFGVAKERDEIVGPEFFLSRPLDEDDLCNSVHSVNEPKDKSDKKKEAVMTKNKANILCSFLIN